MLTFLPPVGDTETLYSICSALHHLRGGPCWKRAGISFFRDPRASSHRQLPRNLDHFCQVTRNLFGTAEEIVHDRTIVGFHARFMDDSAAKRFVAATRGPRNNLIRFPNPEARKLRLCVQCVMDDREALGRGTWRLEHHLGARVCMDHGRDLLEIVFNSYQSSSWLRPDDFVDKNPTLTPVIFSEDQVSWMALAQILWILKSHPRICTPLLHHVLAEKLANIGAITAARFLNSASTASWLKEKSLPFLRHNLQPLSGQWLKFLDGRGTHHPLRWAVIFAACMDPWELNVALGKAYSLQATLEGRWEASGQGHLDLLPQDVWDALLDGISVPEVARNWGRAPASINRALRLNPELKALRDAKITKDILTPKREWVCGFLQRVPHASRADLRKVDSASLRWLDLNDKEWLWRQLPPTKSGRWPQRPLFPVQTTYAQSLKSARASSAI
ncbi:TniQ family protein [Polaromonas sp.]|uniref:TnsD family Tn7-like transposition protein n=1 Tax=Polaromonas sp. TaxID=1869339 RepID=UPI003262D666